MKLRTASLIATLTVLPVLTAQAQTVLPMQTTQPASTTVFPNAAAPGLPNYVNGALVPPTLNSAATAAGQSVPVSALPPDIQKYYSMTPTPGNAATAQQPPTPPKQYYYKAPDPNDPLSGVELPQRLFDNLPERTY